MYNGLTRHFKGLTRHLEPGILRALIGMYNGLTRRFKAGDGFVGVGFASTNGILQGCPISVILLNLFVSVWMRLVEKETGGAARPRSYADDMSAICKTVQTIDIVLHLTQEFEDLSGMRLNVPKCCVWATEPEQRELFKGTRIRGQDVPIVESDRCLGAYLGFDRRQHKTRLSRQLDACVRICERIASTKLPLDIRAHLTSSLVIAKALYGCAATPCGKRSLIKLRRQIAKAVWGQANSWRAPELLFTLVCRGHLVDPVQVNAYQSLLTARSILRKHEDVRELFTTTVSMRQAAKDKGEQPCEKRPRGCILAGLRCCQHDCGMAP